MTAAAGKPRTEAAGIITRLQFAGMKRAEIARQVGVSAETIKAIAAGKSSGDAHLFALRAISALAPRAGTHAAPTTAPAPAFVPLVSPAVPAGPAAGDTPDPSPSGSPQPALDVQEAPKDERTTGQRARDNLRDAILGRGPAAVPVGPSQSAQANADLVPQLVSLLALLVVALTIWRTPDPYTPVCPTHAEASAVLLPLVTALTKTLDVAGQLTETQLAIIQSLLALGVYGTRALETYKAIRADLAQQAPRQQPYAPTPAQSYQQQQWQQPTGFNPFGGTGGGGAPPAPAPVPSAAASAAPPQNTPGFFAARLTPAQPGSADSGTNGVGKFNPFAAVEQLDAIGRTRLGLN